MLPTIYSKHAMDQKNHILIGMRTIAYDYNQTNCCYYYLSNRTMKEFNMKVDLSES